MGITTYIPSNLQGIQISSSTAAILVTFLVMLVFVAGYYVVFEVDKRKMPESF